ncbi:MAG: hypothetical protein WDO19_21785 [Bacteroidota bacterium]
MHTVWGYDGSYTGTWTNVPFSGNHYKIVLSNGTCPNPPTDCSAGIYIKGPGNVQYAYLSAGGNSSNTLYTVIPAANCTIEMSRNDAGSVTGAQAIDL